MIYPYSDPQMFAQLAQQAGRVRVSQVLTTVAVFDGTYYVNRPAVRVVYECDLAGGAHQAHYVEILLLDANGHPQWNASAVKPLLESVPTLYLHRSGSI